jgi:selenocysteine lyase/cysteine desulfurase
VRKTVGRFFGCKTENVALVPNFSLGMNILLEGLDLRQRVLLLENDYPSMNWPFESRRFPISYAKIDAALEQNIWDSIKSDSIDVLALSLVQWLSGIRIDLDFLRQLKKDFPDLIIIADGTQFCGTTNFNFEDSAIDILGSSAYKWLLSGYGNGFMLFKDEIMDRFSLKTTGFNAANADMAKKNEIRFSKHFEPGHLDTLNFGSLKFSLEFLETLGKDKVESQLRNLSDHAKKAFTSLGLLDVDVTGRQMHSTIFNITGKDADFQKLSSNGVICAQRGKGIRLSFHCYNTEKEVDQIVRILKTGQ